MPPRIQLRLVSQPLPLAFRPRLVPARCFTDKKMDPAAPAGSPAAIQQETKDPNMNQLGHVSEEQAAVSKSTGGSGPEIAQGSKVQDVVKGDKELQDTLPKVMQDAIKKKEGQQSRSFSTFSRPRTTFPNMRFFSTAVARHSDTNMDVQRAAEQSLVEGVNTTQFYDQQHDEDDFEYDPDEDELEGVPGAMAKPGHKFGLPEMPLPPGSNMKRRYDTVVEQVTKLLMKDGKLSVAQRNMSEILTHLRTSPAPHTSSKHPLITPTPPQTLPLNPTLYLTLAIDSLAPLFRIRSQRGAAGGGVALQIPVPLGQRQRRRTAVMWLLDAVDKRKGGTSMFAKRFAEEVVAVVEGRSACWARREAVHGSGVRARANLTVMAKGRR